MSGITAEYIITLQNLLAAFEGESNAHAKYSAFAAKADEEGLQGVASLFRATARAEQIHLTNHAKVIGHLGARAECEIHPIKVKSTLENLKAALGGETYEIDTMYPGFLAEAAERSHTEAVRTFTWALEAGLLLRGCRGIKDLPAAKNLIEGLAAECGIWLEGFPLLSGQVRVRNSCE